MDIGTGHTSCTVLGEFPASCSILGEFPAFCSDLGAQPASCSALGAQPASCSYYVTGLGTCRPLGTSLSSLSNPRTVVSLASGFASYTDLGIGHTCTDCGTGIATSLANSLDSCSYLSGESDPGSPFVYRDLGTSHAPYGVIGLAHTGLIISFALASLELLADLMRDLRIAACAHCTRRPASRYSLTSRSAS